MAAPAVLATGLVKRFGDLVAVDGVDLVAFPGTCVGLLGPNGAGKTTAIEMLEGLREPDAGSIEILGRAWAKHGHEIRERIGVQLQETDLLERLTVAETLRLYQSFYRERRDVEEVLRLVGLEEKRDGRIEKLSGGQKQRLTLGCALVNRPELLFLDEPTTGLDPQARRRVWDIVEDFKSNGGTVLLTTHYMEEAERLADEVVVVDHGRVIAQGTPAAIVARLDAESIVEIEPTDGARLEPADFQALEGVSTARREARTLVLSVTDTPRAVAAVLARVEARGFSIDAIHTHRPTLEDVFIAMTGKTLRDG